MTERYNRLNYGFDANAVNPISQQIDQTKFPGFTAKGGLGFAGGAMIHMTISELIPEPIEDGGKSLTAWGVMLGLCTMLLITNLLGLLPIPH